MVWIGLTVEFAGLIGFQPLIVLEMFDKEHASLGVGSHGIQWTLCYFWFRIFKQVKFAFNLYSFMAGH